MKIQEKRRGKLVQAYSSKDLEGILAEEFPATNCDQDVTSEPVEALESNILVVEENVLKDIPPDWWGYKYGFVSGGLLGAQSRKKESAPTEHAQNFHERTAFHEEDQENLYNLVQNKATTGKQGLGIRDRLRKIAGCYFQGKNTSFDDSDGEDSADSSTSPKRKFDDTSEMDKRDEPKVKLKKLCRQLLRQVPGESLKLKQLKALMDEQSIFSNFSSRREALALLKQKLEGSQKFAVEGKRVTLSFK